jgi:regulator of protease activity HflC (stomatin/prohibitin superfamily)
MMISLLVEPLLMHAPWLLCIIAVGWLYQHILIIPDNHVVITERLGTYCRTLKAGWHVLLPLESARVAHWLAATGGTGGGVFVPVGKKLPYDCPPQQCLTKEHIPVVVDTVLYFTVTNPLKMHYATDNPGLMMRDHIVTALTSAVRDMNVHDIRTERLLQHLRSSKELKDFNTEVGVDVGEVRIERLDIPPAILEASSKQATLELEIQAQQSRLALEHEQAVTKLNHVADIQRREREMTLAAEQHAARLRALRAQAEADAYQALLPCLNAVTDVVETRARLFSQFMGKEALAQGIAASSGRTVFIPQRAIELAMGVSECGSNNSVALLSQ